ncbi:hypothetical protein CRM22_009998 [Opisthorchis felineus]|uniref:N-terminal kinase-like protein n=1 Tax=Opisthorchis felineus TaxID=147828 RepID=A0A4S2L3G9_OPIFE|nr:hypothetical protein CRM22_009998 [Opisthorchis felineus]
MWLFSNKDSTPSLSSIGSMGLNFTSDPVAGFALTASENTVYHTIDGAFGLEWQVRNAYNKKKNADEVSVFSCNLQSVQSSMPMTGSVVESLHQTTRWMKTLRHPNILNWIAGTELASGQKLPIEFHLITERVVPLRDYLRVKADSGNFNLMSSWGIYQISRALSFLNDDAKLTHNAVRMDAVFVTTAGEWKLGALDFVGPVDDPPPSSRSTAAFVRLDQNGSDPYLPPDTRLVDSWGLGCFIWELFNPNTSLRDRSQLSSPDALQRLPASLVSSYRRLIALNGTVRGPKRRLTVTQFLDQARNSDKQGFFVNEYVDTLLFLEEIQLKDPQEKTRFLSALTDQVSSFPDDVCRHKILPHLLNGLRYGSAGVEALIPILRLIPLLSSSEFESNVLPCLVKLFAAPERATRVRLLEQLPNFVKNLPPKAVESQIFTSVATGFSDANPVVREATVRAMVHLAPKLSAKLLNDTLPRYLIGVQAKDEQGGIRTNATICLAKLATQFSTQVQQGVLLNAFLRATRDQFVPARKAALSALAATQDLYKTDQLAGKLLPCLSFLTVDPEKSIRDDAFQSIYTVLDHLKKVSDGIIASTNAAPGACSTPGTDVKVNPSRGAVASLVGSFAWSALSYSSKLIASATSGSGSKVNPVSVNEPTSPQPPMTTNAKPTVTNQLSSLSPASSITMNSSSVLSTETAKQSTKDESRQPPKTSKSMSLKSHGAFDQIPSFEDDQDGWGPEGDDGWGNLEVEETPENPGEFGRRNANIHPVDSTNDWARRSSKPASDHLGWDADEFFATLTLESSPHVTRPVAHKTAENSSKPAPTTAKPKSKKVVKSKLPTQSTVTSDDNSWGDW